MCLDEISVGHLRFLVEVLDCGSITSAAKALYMSQAGLSQHMRTLEERTGQRLLRRTARGVQPTAVGEQFAEAARAWLDALDSVYAYRDGGNVGVPPTADAAVIDAVRARLGRFIDLVACDSGDALRRVASRELEAAATLDLPLAGDKRMWAQPLLRRELGVLASAETFRRIDEGNPFLPRSAAASISIESSTAAPSVTAELPSAAPSITTKLLTAAPSATAPSVTPASAATASPGEEPTVSVPDLAQIPGLRLLVADPARAPRYSAWLVRELQGRSWFPKMHYFDPVSYDQDSSDSTAVHEADLLALPLMVAIRPADAASREGSLPAGLQWRPLNPPLHEEWVLVRATRPNCPEYHELVP